MTNVSTNNQGLLLGYTEKSATYPILPQNAWHVNCQDEYNDVGVCDNWWYDSAASEAFALFKLDSIGKNSNDLMSTMFQNGWTTGEDLFEGSMSCLW